MKLHLASSAVVLGSLLASGCASVDTAPTAEEPRQPPHYRTGSNIPVKQAPGSMTDEEKQRAMDQMRRTSPPRPAASPP